MAFAAVALVSAAWCAAQAPAVTFDIASQPMAAALNAWAVQANVQVFVDPGPIAHLTAPAVKGTLTPRQALRALLAHSNLQVSQGADGVFVIKPRPAVAAVTAPPPEAPPATAVPVPAAAPVALTARASSGPWLVGFGVDFARDHAGASGGAAGALDGEYFMTDRFAAAFAATTPRTHSFEVPGAAPYRGSARLQSSALTLKYYFAPESSLDPFLGAGLNVTTLYGATGVVGLDRVTAGPTFEAGIAILLNARWMLNAGVSWAQVSPEAGTDPARQIHLDPVQFGLGFVYRFGASGDFLKRR
ncbi:MAG TPA: OmpW family outer membrane protein [Steroidobacteraceae bacterium]|nr:OmpW family outer membrane protein [Steroidobacteraceae bacterium]